MNAPPTDAASPATSDTTTALAPHVSPVERALAAASEAIASAIAELARDERRGKFVDIERLAAIGQAINRARGRRVADFHVRDPDAMIAQGGPMIIDPAPLDADGLPPELRPRDDTMADASRLAREMLMQANAHRADAASERASRAHLDEISELQQLSMLHVSLPKGPDRAARQRTIQKRMDALMQRMEERNGQAPVVSADPSRRHPARGRRGPTHEGAGVPADAERGAGDAPAARSRAR